MEATRTDREVSRIDLVNCDDEVLAQAEALAVRLQLAAVELICDVRARKLGLRPATQVQARKQDNRTRAVIDRVQALAGRFTY